MRSILATLRATSIKPGNGFYLPRLQRATRYLQDTLGKQGHLAAQVKFIAATYDQDTNRADLKFAITMGPLVHADVKGMRLWPWNRYKLIPMYSEKSIDRDLVQEGERNLLSYLQSKGYFDAAVRTHVERQPSSVTVLYQITQGPRHRVTSVSVAGSRYLSQKQLLDHVTVKKAIPLWLPSTGNTATTCSRPAPRISPMFTARLVSAR